MPCNTPVEKNVVAKKERGQKGGRKPVAIKIDDLTDEQVLKIVQKKIDYLSKSITALEERSKETNIFTEKAIVGMKSTIKEQRKLRDQFNDIKSTNSKERREFLKKQPMMYAKG